MKVTVIIPAYNAEKYLVETLESVVNQTLDDYEVIVVNDGSKDSTLDILRGYEEKYPNLKVIDKENEGVSAARNDALNVACGKYVFFFDSDDLLESDALESLYTRAEEKSADLVVAGYDIFSEYGVTEVKDLDEILILDSIEKYDERILWTFSLWNKLFKKEIIDKYNFRFPPISYSEDGSFVMNYVYHISKITGLDQVVTHYRKMAGEDSTITGTISDWKVKDYIEAHKIILNYAEESILRDFPKYRTIDEAREDSVQIRNYLNKIIYKELSILIKQFYAKFWALEEDTVKSIVDEITDKLKFLDAKNALLIADENPDICISDLQINKEAMLEKAVFTAVLFGNEENREEFLESLASLTMQNLVGIKIVVPESMKKIIENEGLLTENMIFEKAETEKQLFELTLAKADTKYITFCDSKFIYTINAFKFAFKRFIKTQKDFITELIYHNNFGDPQPVYLNRIAQESVSMKMEFNPDLCMDNTLANKFFDVEFLRKLKVSAGENLLSYLEEVYRSGAYAFFNDGIVIYNDTEESFMEYNSTDETRPYIEECLKDKAPVDLNDEDIVVDPGEAFVKLLDSKPKTFSDVIMKWAIKHYSKKRVQNRTLFVTVRKDGELEGNAKALYPYVKGEKVICAQRLPHNNLTMIKMIKLIVTSKVIVTDDYVKYLRHFTLKPEQRVIQLWHACGAFKKFGQRGTNMAIKTDMATHAQYNIACVSGEHIRTIYADAFNINLKKVKALGCPRTDDFFDEKLIEEKKRAIYAKYPELKDKYVIIYAPTFRDIGEGRTVFNPQLDFDKLSQNLLPDQEFIICPHPVMKNDIIPKKYPNIRVMRDFSTNDLMFVSDMLITDYSSVIFEYALLRKPIAFFCYDLSIYNRGFYLKYPDDLPGDVYETQEQLQGYLTNPDNRVLSDKYKLFVERYMSGCDGNSCERIAGIINAYMEDK